MRGLFEWIGLVYHSMSTGYWYWSNRNCWEKNIVL